MNQDKLIRHLITNFNICRRGKSILLVDDVEYKRTSFNKFLTNKRLAELESDLLSLEDGEKKDAISAIANKVMARVDDYDDSEMDEEFQIPEDSILSTITSTSQELMNYRPVKDLRNGLTYMFCITSEMIAEIDFLSWLELAPKNARKIKQQPCIAIYDPIEEKKCYAGMYHPTTDNVEIEVLYINEHIKPEWRV